MRNISLIGVSFALILGSIEAQSSLASSVNRSELFTKIKIQKNEIKKIGDRLDAVGKEVVEANELLQFIKETFEDTGDPDLVLDDLEEADQVLKDIENEVDSISKKLALINETLKEISNIVRKFKLTRLERELKMAFELLDTVERRFSGDREKVASSRKAFDQLAKKISSSLTAVGGSDLKPVDDSGVEASIVFVDDGRTLRVVGTATGLDPAETYLSNIYDVGSVSEGPGACVPSIFDPKDPDFILPTMFLGFWEVDADGNGRLCAINTNSGADFVPLDKIGTVSVRLIVAPPPAPDAPPMTQLVACGRVNEQRRP